MGENAKYVFDICHEEEYHFGMKYIYKGGTK